MIKATEVPAEKIKISAKFFQRQNICVDLGVRKQEADPLAKPKHLEF